MAPYPPRCAVAPRARGSRSSALVGTLAVLALVGTLAAPPEHALDHGQVQPGGAVRASRMHSCCIRLIYQRYISLALIRLYEADTPLIQSNKHLINCIRSISGHIRLIWIGLIYKPARDTQRFNQPDLGDLFDNILKHSARYTRDHARYTRSCELPTTVRRDRASYAATAHATRADGIRAVAGARRRPRARA